MKYKQKRKLKSRCTWIKFLTTYIDLSTITFVYISFRR